MKILVRNNAKVANKYVRFAKWRIWKLKRKFDQLLYAEMHIDHEGHFRKEYTLMLRLAVPGKDLVFKLKDSNIKVLCSEAFGRASRAMAQEKAKNTNLYIQYRNQLYNH